MSAPFQQYERKPIVAFNHDLPALLELVKMPKVKKVQTTEDGGSMKFFEEPVYVCLHGTIVQKTLKYNKFIVEIPEVEAKFIKDVEDKIMKTYNGLLERAEPSIDLTQSIATSALFDETKFRVKVNDKITKKFRAVDGAFVQTQDEILEDGSSILITYAISGLHQSARCNGVFGYAQSYMVA